MVLAAALVLALVSVVVAVVFQRTAEERASEARAAGTVADANRLAALSSSARSLDLSLLLAVAAVRTAATPATEDGLLNALVEHRRATGVHELSAEGIQETALSANGRSMAFAIGGGSPRVMAWEPGTSQPPHVIAEDDWGPEHLAFSPDGETLVGVNSVPTFRAYTVGGDRLPGSTTTHWTASRATWPSPRTVGCCCSSATGRARASATAAGWRGSTWRPAR